MQAGTGQEVPTPTARHFVQRARQGKRREDASLLPEWFTDSTAMEPVTTNLPYVASRITSSPMPQVSPDTDYQTVSPYRRNSRSRLADRSTCKGGGQKYDDLRSAKLSLLRIRSPGSG